MVSSGVPALSAGGSQCPLPASRTWPKRWSVSAVIPLYRMAMVTGSCDVIKVPKQLILNEQNTRANQKGDRGRAGQTWWCMPIISIFGGGGRRVRNSGTALATLWVSTWDSASKEKVSKIWEEKYCVKFQTHSKQETKSSTTCTNRQTSLSPPSHNVQLIPMSRSLHRLGHFC